MNNLIQRLVDMQVRGQAPPAPASAKGTQHPSLPDWTVATLRHGLAFVLGRVKKRSGEGE